eukprot:TRINITY_DN9545_c0_g1_i1.p1 TRINITY_DN9545_c0_g1~~TRINITY_DN9545_c0_g1_i1.p1  ORF type:complete len:507 (+),score=72.37 TRINITY_DN9545_c0_g1_i1:7-1527(+)
MAQGWGCLMLVLQHCLFMSGSSESRAMLQDALGVGVHPSILRKTKLCSFYQAGVCSRGVSCSFAHSPEELMQQPDFSKTRLCESYTKSGMCVHGKLCTFAHGVDDLRGARNNRSVAQKGSAELSQPAASASSEKNTSSVEASELMTLQDTLAKLTEQNLRKGEELLQRRFANLLQNCVTTPVAPVRSNQVALQPGSIVTSAVGTSSSRLNLEALHRHQVASHPQGVAASFDPGSSSLQHQHATVQQPPSAVLSTLASSKLDAELLQSHRADVMPQLAKASFVAHVDQSQNYQDFPQPSSSATSSVLTSSQLNTEQLRHYHLTAQQAFAEASAAPTSSTLETEWLRRHRTALTPRSPSASYAPFYAYFHREQSQLFPDSSQPGRGATYAVLTSSQLYAEQPQRYQATSQQRCAEASAVPTAFRVGESAATTSSRLERDPPLTTRRGTSGDFYDADLSSLRQHLRMWSCHENATPVNVCVRNGFLTFEREESQPGSTIRSKSLPEEKT